MPQNQVCCRTLVYICLLRRWNRVWRCRFLLSCFSSWKDVAVCLLSGAAFLMLFMHVYVGTTCYSQGCASLRPVSPSVYSLSRLLPPDYKKDWWINNMQLSPAVSHILEGLEVCWRVRACSCLYLHRCLCGSVCDGMCECLVSLASLGGPGSPLCGWFPGPYWQEAVRKAFPLGQSQGQTWRGREKHPLHPQHHLCIPFWACLLWCVKHLKIERTERHAEKRRAAVKRACILLRSTGTRGTFQTDFESLWFPVSLVKTVIVNWSPKTYRTFKLRL